MRVYEEYIRAHAVMELDSRRIAMGKWGGLRIFVDHDHAAKWITDRTKYEVVEVYIVIEVKEGETARSPESAGEYKGSRGDERKK